jgi:hypothetical protein
MQKGEPKKKEKCAMVIRAMHSLKLIKTVFSQAKSAWIMLKILLMIDN